MKTPHRIQFGIGHTPCMNVGVRAAGDSS